ncbi:hypothetical protein [Dehalobacter sp.]|uniref:hypothetical protein n=1 Tax=Dehalobacter sp. TaxID=1962289 RepID=UPI002585068F|nr:hypothetical protein [Dehalobacter sp.]MCG1026296.1 hypothetical protein [Dehalobacter sp.]
MNTVLDDKEKYILEIRKLFNDFNQGKIDAIIEELVLKQLIRNNKENISIKENLKLTNDEVMFLQAFRLLNKEYKHILADNMFELYSDVLNKELPTVPKLMVIK